MIYYIGTDFYSVSVFRVFFYSSYMDFQTFPSAWQTKWPATFVYLSFNCEIPGARIWEAVSTDSYHFFYLSGPCCLRPEIGEYPWVPAAPSWVPGVTEAHLGSRKEEKKPLKPTNKDITDICWQMAINSAKTGACYLAVSWDPRLNGKRAITVQPPSSECSPFALGEGR